VFDDGAISTYDIRQNIDDLLTECEGVSDEVN
jgi:hypothetical protein